MTTLLDTKEGKLLLDRIEKIRALAEGPGATQHEAEVAAAKMQELLLKYNITMVQLDAHARRTNQTVRRQRVEVARRDWRWYLLDAVARAHLGYTVISTDTEHDCEIVHVFAFSHNLIIIKDVYEWLCVEIGRLCAIRHTEAVAEGDMNAQKRKLQWTLEFKAGCVAGLNEAYARQREALRQTTPADQWALVPLAEKEVMAAVDAAFPIRGHGGNAHFQTNAYREGQKAGRNINVDRQVRSTRPVGQIGR